MASTEVVVAIVALIVSLVALSATFMQVLQQYYASAAGYLQCNEKVMGSWAKSKRRRFLWEELRFEVQFESPVIFVSPPTNTNGPVRGAKLYFLDGTQKSIDDTGTATEVDPRKEYQTRTIKEKVHTADNERATWFTLLVAIQDMEKVSRVWQENQYKDIGPPGAAPDLPRQPPPLKDVHTLTVALQRKTRTWDTMPSTITKPYATTTMCHLIEMMAALGVYWKEFDRKRDRYRAEGNGFAIMGERYPDLGLMFSFQVYGKYQFNHSRVVPLDEVKELCFGYVPTIFRETLDQRRLEFPSDDAQNLSTLQMSSSREIAETLGVIGCNNNTVNYFLTDGARTSHLFPITFEILGFLSRAFHIRDSGFTYLPNPTPDRWDKRPVSLINMMEFYNKFVKVNIVGVERNLFILSHIQKHIDAVIAHHYQKTVAGRLRFLKALHMAVEDMDEILTARSKKQSGNIGNNPGTQRAVPEEGRRVQVQDVLRSHLQLVLRLLNERSDRNDSQSLRVPEIAPPSPTSRPHEGSKPPLPSFQNMDLASPDERQREFMNIYFSVIRPEVVQMATSSASRRASIIGEARPETVYAPPTETTAINQTDTPQNGQINQPSQSNGKASGEVVSAPPVEAKVNSNAPSPQIPLAQQPASLDDIWCTLVFRMICWLMLHDFNKSDVQVSKSDLLGSRMPVYIA